MPYFSASENVTANKMNSIVGFVAKTADESVSSSATLQNDDHLLYTIPGAGTYVFDVWLYGLSAANAAGDIVVGFTFPTGTMRIGGSGPDANLASGNIEPGQWGASTSYTTGAIFNAYGLSTGAVTIYLHGTLVATASGTLQFQWAQAASNANASTLKAGSHMCVTQVL